MLSYSKNKDFYRLMQRRANLFPFHKERIFQLSDYFYAEALPQLELTNNKLLLYCKQADNLGDVSQLFFWAKKIREQRPQCEITVAIFTNTIKADKIRELFPADQFNTVFVDDRDFVEKEKRITPLLQSTGVLGIAMDIGTGQLYRTHHRFLREYGFSHHPDVKGRSLSMGLTKKEEGITIPTINKRSLSEIQTDWVKDALAHSGKIFHMHVREWATQTLMLYSISEIEKDNATPFSVTLPMQHSLQALIDWGAIDMAVLKRNGIGKIKHITAEGIAETITLQENGKEMQILSGSIPKSDMEIIQQHAENFFGCTGDMSISEAIALKKIPCYDAPSHKMKFFDSIKKIATDNQWDVFLDFLNLIDKFGSQQFDTYKAHTPKKIPGSFWGGAAAESSYEIDKADSVARKSLNELAPLMEETAKKLAACYANPKLLEQAQAFDQYIQDNYNVESRVLSMVDRALILNNYPQLIKIENELLESFKASETNDPAEVFKTLKNEIESAVKPRPTIIQTRY